MRCSICIHLIFKFLFRLTDDQGYADVGFTNPDTPFVTKNIDKLAKKSVK